jgi:hypothetical protein
MSAALTVEQLQAERIQVAQRLAKLKLAYTETTEREKRLLADLQATAGALEFCDLLLAKAEKAPCSTAAATPAEAGKTPA